MVRIMQELFLNGLTERKIVYETSDRQRGELLNKTVDNWEKNIKSALKYVPGITGATLVPKNKNSQPSN